MRWLTELWSRLVLSARPKAADQRIDEEMAFHLEHLTEKLRARGASDSQARRQAAVLFGGQQGTREEARDQFRAMGLEAVWRDARYAWRRVRRESHGHTLLMVSTLAIGLGLTTAMFSVADAVLWNRVPFPDAARLVVIASESRQPGASGQSFLRKTAEPSQLLAWREQSDIFDRVEAYQSIVAVYQASSGAHLVRGAAVTPGMLSILGFRPDAGRSFGEGEGETGSERVAIISHGFWDQHYRQAADTIGQHVELDRLSYRVVGIAPSTFSFPDRATQIWIPADPSAAGVAGNADRRAPMSMWIPVARLAQTDGLTREHADTLGRARGEAVNASAWIQATGAALVPLEGDAAERTRRTVLLLVFGVGLLLAVICINAAALSLSATLARQSAWAMKSALGASRAALIREVLFEHALILFAGALAGLAVASGALHTAGTLLPNVVVSALNPADLDGRALLFAVGASAVAGLLFAAPSVFIAARRPYAAITAQGGRRTSASKRTQRLRAALIVSEVALSLVLLIGTMLMGRTLVSLYAVERGLDASGLVAIGVALPRDGYAGLPARERFVSDAVDVLRSLPGVQSVSSGDLPPGNSMKLVLGTMTGVGSGEASLMHSLYEVRPDFFGTARIPFVAGGTFAAEVQPGSIIVSDAFAEAHWGSAEQAVSQSFQISGHVRTIVGVVRSVRSLATNSPERVAQIYHRAGVDYDGGMAIGVSAVSTIADRRTLLVRLTDEAPSLRTLADVVQQLDRTVVVRSVESVEDVARTDVAPSRFILGLVATAGFVAMLISTIGLYGLMTHTVALRRQELGIRLALGATPGSIGRAVLARGLVVTAAGVLVGLMLAVPAVELIRAELFGVEPFDPLAIAMASGLLVLAAAMASWRPTLHATRVDPSELLRSE